MTTKEPHADPILALKRERPDLFEAPPFWRSSLDDADAQMASARRGQTSVLGTSAGGRTIHVIAYGDPEPQRPTATISSAMGSDRPETFFDPAKRTKPCLVLIGPLHGGEVEGLVVNLNIIRIMETGRDWLDRPQDRLQGLLEKVRLVVVPCLNPDGRAKAGIAHLNGADVDHLYLVQQGLRKDGSLLRGRAVKEVQPIPDGMLQFRGGYYNDNGVNLQHDDFFGPAPAPETRAIADLVRREIPDGFLTWHSHGAPVSFTSPDEYVSPGARRKQSEVTFFILSQLLSRGFDAMDPRAATGPAWSFTFQTYLHHACGALPLVCELTHGLRSSPCPLERILDIGLTVVESWVEFALRFGLRPQHLDFHGPPPPA